MSPKVFGIIGNPVAQSFSPDYFNEKFKRLRLPFEYKRFGLEDISEVEDVFQKEPNLVGLNVTSPFKASIIPFLSDYDDDVKTLKAVNTISLTNRGRIGHNTDIIGFEATLRSLNLSRQNCLVLGSGGAASAVIYVLKKRNCSFIQASRNPKGNMIGYGQIDQLVLANYPVVINATSLGMSHNVETKPSLPYTFVGPNNVLIDLVYQPRVTAFLHEGLKRGSRIKNGYEMLIYQAEASWKIWTNDMEFL